MSSAADRAGHLDLRSLFRDYVWLARDLAEGRLARLVGLVLVSCVSVAARAASALVVVVWLRGELGSPTTIFGVSMPSGTDLSTLSFYALAAVGMALLAAALAYSADALAFSIARGFGEEGYRRILERLSLGRIWSDTREEPRQATIKLLIRVMRLVRVLFTTLSSLGQVLLLVVGVSALLYIHPWLTLGVGVVASLFAVPFLQFNRGIFQASLGLDENRRASRGLISDVVDVLMSSVPSTALGRSTVERFVSARPIQGMLESYRVIVLTRARVGFVKDAALGVALGLLVFAFGWSQTPQGADLSLALAYVIALRWVVSSSTALATSVTTMSRFHPAVERFVELMRADLDESPSEGVDPPEEPAVRLAERSLSAGEHLELVADRVDRDSLLEQLCGGLPELRTQLESRAVWVSPPRKSRGLSLGEERKESLGLQLFELLAETWSPDRVLLVLVDERWLRGLAGDERRRVDVVLAAHAVVRFSARRQARREPVDDDLFDDD